MSEGLTSKSPGVTHLGSLVLLALVCGCASARRAPEPPMAQGEKPDHQSAPLSLEGHPEVPPPLPGGLLTARPVAEAPLVLFAERPEYLATHLSLAFPASIRPERALLVQLQIQASTNAREPQSDESDCPPSQLCLTLPGTNGGRFLPSLTEAASFTPSQTRALREQARTLLLQTTQSFRGRAALHLGFSMSEDSRTSVGPAYLDSLGDAELAALVSDTQRQATACVVAPRWAEPRDTDAASPPPSAKKEFQPKASSSSEPDTQLRALYLNGADPSQDKLLLAFAFPAESGRDPSHVLDQIRQKLEGESLTTSGQSSILPMIVGLALEVSTEQLVDTMRVIRDVFTSATRPGARSPSPSGPGPDLGACDRYQLEHASNNHLGSGPQLHFYLEGSLQGGSPELALVSVTSSHGQHLRVPHGAATP